MQVFAYPGDRIDFVSASGSAGSIEFGDPISLIEEFFGTAHSRASSPNSSGETLGYFNDSLVLDFLEGNLVAVTVTPHRSREKIKVFEDRQAKDIAPESSITWRN